MSICPIYSQNDIETQAIEYDVSKRWNYRLNRVLPIQWKTDTLSTFIEIWLLVFQVFLLKYYIPSNFVTAIHLKKRISHWFLTRFQTNVNIKFIMNILPLFICLHINIATAIISQQAFAQITIKWNIYVVLWALFQPIICINDKKFELVLEFRFINR